MNPLLDEIQQLIGYRFKKIDFLKQALVHRSSLNEHKEFAESNERFEFLGDAILELWVSDRLFNLFLKFDEGKLTNLRALIVCTDNLAKISLEINLGKFIFLSHGEENHNGRQNTSILADTFEAIIGAVYLDGGVKTAFKVLDTHLNPSITQFSAQKIYKDPKSIFQEIAQAQNGFTPKYKTISESGPDHQKKFEVGVYIEDQLIATGSGNSKQKAQEAASLLATELYNKNN